jgi:prepilin peptidase CpaA
VTPWPYLLAAALLLGFAAWRDLATRTVPDLLALALALAGLATRATEGWTAIALSAAVALLLFAVLLIPAIAGVLGGGDVKLAAAVALGLPPAATWDFVTATVLVGGLLGLAYLAGPRLAPRPALSPGAAPLRRIAAVEAWRLRRRGPVPYAVAIAAGALLVLLGPEGR